MAAIEIMDMKTIDKPLRFIIKNIMLYRFRYLEEECRQDGLYWLFINNWKLQLKFYIFIDYASVKALRSGGVISLEINFLFPVKFSGFWANLFAKNSWTTSELSSQIIKSMR